MLKLHNTLTKRDDQFLPIEHNLVRLYTCGPTVYDYLHVGNWAAYIYWDILVRTLIANDYQVERVMNITDVGHLVSDADDGQDKLEKGAKREGKTAWEVAEFYTVDFLAGMNSLNLLPPAHITKATDYIDEQLDLIRQLSQKGFLYQIDDGIYFDTSLFPSYADFAHLNLDAQKAGARVDFNSQKRHISDFAVWKFTPAGQARDMEWVTPTDVLDKAPDKEVMGFPGWHLECSAMALTLLGDTIDIHTGGIDHIPVHHTNEIAQSEAATGKIFSNYWLHNNHLKVEGTKISKSLGNGYTLSDLQAKGYSPMDYRMFVLQSHYQSEGNFSFDNIEAAKNHLNNWRSVAAMRHQLEATPAATTAGSAELRDSLTEALNDNLNTPKALQQVDAGLPELVAGPTRQAIEAYMQAVDDLLGLGILESTPDIDDDTKQLIKDRQQARTDKDWAAADRLRDELAARGIKLNDSGETTFWQYI